MAVCKLQDLPEMSVVQQRGKVLGAETNMLLLARHDRHQQSNISGHLRRVFFQSLGQNDDVRELRSRLALLLPGHPAISRTSTYDLLLLHSGYDQLGCSKESIILKRLLAVVVLK